MEPVVQPGSIDGLVLTGLDVKTKTTVKRDKDGLFLKGS